MVLYGQLEALNTSQTLMETAKKRLSKNMLNRMQYISKIFNKTIH